MSEATRTPETFNAPIKEVCYTIKMLRRATKSYNCNPFNFYLNDGDALPTVESVLSEDVATDHGSYYMAPKDIKLRVMIVGKVTISR